MPSASDHSLSVLQATQPLQSRISFSHFLLQLVNFKLQRGGCIPLSQQQLFHLRLAVGGKFCFAVKNLCSVHADAKQVLVHRACEFGILCDGWSRSSPAEMPASVLEYYIFGED